MTVSQKFENMATIIWTKLQNEVARIKPTRAKTDGFNDSRDWRLEAIIPKEMFYVARKIWGDDVITNPQKFKEAFVKDEQGRMCLTVDPKTI